MGLDGGETCGGTFAFLFDLHVRGVPQRDFPEKLPVVFPPQLLRLLAWKNCRTILSR